MRRNQSSGAPELRAKLARGSAGFGAGPNKRDFSGFGGSWNVENSQVYRHLHRLPFSVPQGKQCLALTSGLRNVIINMDYKMLLKEG